MATRSKKTSTESAEQNAAVNNVEKSNTSSANQVDKANDKQSQLATILVGLLIIASGLLIYNYFQRTSTPETTNQTEQQKNEQAQNNDDKDKNGESDSDSDAKEGQYTVEPGDSLWSIAEKTYGNGFDWTKIRDANSLELNAYGQPTVEIGQVLNIPDSAAVAQQPGSEQNVADPSDDSSVAGIQEIRETPSTAIQTYTVQHGDTLWSIAETVYGDGTKWEVIMNNPHNQLGQLPDGRPLVHSGNVLYIPEIL